MKVESGTGSVPWAVARAEEPLVAKLGLEPNSLSGLVAVVTGAGRGIGRSTALAFSRLGASVVMAEVSDSGAETERLVRAHGGTALFVRTDVAAERDVDRLRRRVESAAGPQHRRVRRGSRACRSPCRPPGHILVAAGQPGEAG